MSFATTIDILLPGGHRAKCSIEAPYEVLELHGKALTSIANQVAATIDHATKQPVLSATKAITGAKRQRRNDDTYGEDEDPPPTYDVRTLSDTPIPGKTIRLVNIEFRDLGGKKWPYRVYPDDTIDNLKTRYSDMTGMAPDVLRFIWGGHQLEDGRTVADASAPYLLDLTATHTDQE